VEIRRDFRKEAQPDHLEGLENPPALYNGALVWAFIGCVGVERQCIYMLFAQNHVDTKILRPPECGISQRINTIAV
jgi:hypothetical protein